MSGADRAQLEAGAVEGDLLVRLDLTTAIRGCELAAWLLTSRRLDRELWLVRGAAGLELIRDDLADTPVVLADQLSTLWDLDTDTLRAVVDAKGAFPGARLVEAPS